MSSFSLSTQFSNVGLTININVELLDFMGMPFNI